MDEAPGRLLGRGRHADVYEHCPGSVVRRYRTGQSAEPEAAVIAHVRSFGFPAPAVLEVTGPTMVMERVDGPSLLHVMARQPWAMAGHASLLVGLHHRLHEIDAPEGLERPVGDGHSLLHMDLQPANVVITDGGPVVLDWGWAAAGPPAVDLAHTWLQLATSEVPGGSLMRAAGRVGRSWFVNLFLRSLDRDALAAVLPSVSAYRLARRELTAGERADVRDFVRRTMTEGPTTDPH